jgi:predicted signal transduction protein with EAL and GGDEF domain
VIGRLGGDEFVVAQYDLDNVDEAKQFAKRMLTLAMAPMTFKGREIAITVSIGVALFPADGVTSERLLKCADLAVYNAKASGRNCFRLFTPDMDESMQWHIALEKHIRESIEQDKLELHYQPVFGEGGKRLEGFEALLRLPRLAGKLIPPETFIPVAQEMRLVNKIGAWVLHAACRTAATWPRHLTVAVNLSPTEFNSGRISDIVAGALGESGLEPDQLELEITEALMLGNSETTMAQLHKLKAMGVKIVMDDFGMGYANLSYLWQFPFDKIKIDRMFMQGVDENDANAKVVVRSMIALGRELHMRVTAEGVESAEQAAFLNMLEIDQVQGFYFGKPVPAIEVANVILADIKRDGRRGPEPKVRLIK